MSKNLSLLGVPESVQHRAPSKITFPRAFVPDARATWNAVFDDQNVKAVLNGQSQIDQWETAVSEFLARCKAKGLDPFPSLDTVQNTRIISLLGKTRKLIGEVLTAANFLPDFKTQNVERTVTTRNNSLSIVVKANLIAKSGVSVDTARMALLLMDAKFYVITSGRVYRRSVNSTDYVQVSMNPRGWTLEYSVSVSLTPSTNLMDTKKFDKWVINSLWMPAVRATKFSGRSLI